MLSVVRSVETINLGFSFILFFFRMYQLEKDDGTEFSATIVHHGPSKMSLTAQQLVKKTLI